MAKTIKQLSRRARKLLDRIHAGKFYRWTDQPGPAMQELLDAGFVGTSGRVTKIEACFVPKGFKSMSHEKYPSWTCAHMETFHRENVTQDGEYTESYDKCAACGHVVNYKATPIPKKIEDTNSPVIKRAFTFGSLIK